jgi:hypothetical protein
MDKTSSRSVEKMWGQGQREESPNLRFRLRFQIVRIRGLSAETALVVRASSGIGMEPAKLLPEATSPASRSTRPFPLGRWNGRYGVPVVGVATTTASTFFLSRTRRKLCKTLAPYFAPTDSARGLKTSQTATTLAPSGSASRICCLLRPTPITPRRTWSFAPWRRGLAKTWEGINVGIVRAAALIKKWRRVGVGSPPSSSMGSLRATACKGMAFQDRKQEILRQESLGRGSAGTPLGEMRRSSFRRTPSGSISLREPVSGPLVSEDRGIPIRFGIRMS